MSRIFCTSCGAQHRELKPPAPLTGYGCGICKKNTLVRIPTHNCEPTRSPKTLLRDRVQAFVMVVLFILWILPPLRALPVKPDSLIMLGYLTFYAGWVGYVTREKGLKS